MSSILHVYGIQNKDIFGSLFEMYTKIDIHANLENSWSTGKVLGIESSLYWNY